MCDFLGFEDFQRLFANFRTLLWDEENHGTSMLLCFPQPDWSEWPFTLIWPEQLSAVWKYGIFTQCIKADDTYPLLGAMKMVLPLHFAASVYLIQWMWVCSLHYCWGFIHSFHGIIQSFWKAIEYINHCYRWTDSLTGFLCCFPCPVFWSNILTE